MGCHPNTNNQPFCAVFRCLAGYALSPLVCTISVSSHRDGASGIRKASADYLHSGFEKEWWLLHSNPSPTHGAKSNRSAHLQVIPITPPNNNCKEHFRLQQAVHRTTYVYIKCGSINMELLYITPHSRALLTLSDVKGSYLRVHPMREFALIRCLSIFQCSWYVQYHQ